MYRPKNSPSYLTSTTGASIRNTLAGKARLFGIPYVVSSGVQGSCFGPLVLYIIKYFFVLFCSIYEDDVRYLIMTRMIIDAYRCTYIHMYICMHMCAL
jgi:hypothetical protein